MEFQFCVKIFRSTRTSFIRNGKRDEIEMREKMCWTFFEIANQRNYQGIRIEWGTFILIPQYISFISEMYDLSIETYLDRN